MLSCKIPSSDIVTIADYRFSLAEGMFHNALNQRFFKISRKQDPPFFSCSTSSEAFVRPVKAYIMSANCKERGTLQALESMLTEVSSSFTGTMRFPSHVPLSLIHWILSFLMEKGESGRIVSFYYRKVVSGRPQNRIFTHFIVLMSHCFVLPNKTAGCQSTSAWIFR